MASSDDLIHDDTDYSDYLDFPSCHVLRYLDYDERCDYVSSEEGCEQGNIVNYISYAYCTLSPYDDFTHFLVILHLLILIALIFYITSTTADQFFCPPLKVLCKLMHMNEHLAGVTLLAFGNGAPDLFTTMVDLEDNTRLFYNDTTGGCLFVIGLVLGVVCLINPFKAISSNFMKDALFYLTGALFIDFALLPDGVVKLWEAIVIFGIYFLYIIAVLVDQALSKQAIRILSARNDLSESEKNDLIDLMDQMEIEVVNIKDGERISINPQDTRVRVSKELILDTLIYLNPIDEEEWNESKWFKKATIVITAPLIVALRLLMPVCDYELERHGWCKLLNCLQFVYTPLLFFWYCFPDLTVLGVPGFLLPGLLTVPLAILLFWRTRADRPPKIHFVFAIYGCLMAILVIFICSEEIMEILTVLCLATGGTKAFLGCTILALGNNVGDWVANYSLAKQGYQKMAFSACFGGPLFNAHLTFGFVMLYNAIQNPDHQIEVSQGPLRDTLFLFNALLIMAIIFIMISTNYHVRRAMGAFTLCLYLIFFLYAVMGEAEIVQAWSDSF